MLIMDSEDKERENIQIFQNSFKMAWSQRVRHIFLTVQTAS